MKVLLRKDIKGVGRRGDIVEVKSGYARNFLVPSGSGLFASAEMEAQAASMRRSRDLKDAADKASAEVQKGVIESASITIASRAGTNGRLFGSVTEADIVNAIRTATNISLDRHAVKMEAHLKEIGTATVAAELFEGVVANVTLTVVAK